MFDPAAGFFSIFFSYITLLLPLKYCQCGSASYSAAMADFSNKPYFQRLQGLVHAFPALQSFLKKMQNEDYGRVLVRSHYLRKHNRVPGRCYGLRFRDAGVSVLPESDRRTGFGSPEILREYLKTHPAYASRRSGEKRLFILEDLEPDYVDMLGEHLGIDPLVVSEQMNTWNFTTSSSIAYRGLPSTSSPKQSFTLKYYDIQTLQDPSSVDALTFQMTFAINRRRYERWRDVDLPLAQMNSKQAFVRRCASFWTSQGELAGSRESGWDGRQRPDICFPHLKLTILAVIMVDPAMSTGPPENTKLILRDPTNHKTRTSLWHASDWAGPRNVEAVEHRSAPYQDGCHTLASCLFPHLRPDAKERIEAFQQKRDRESPLDELVFYWTKIASKELVAEACSNSSNTTHFLLKHIAQHWLSQLELINCTIAMGEYFSDDCQVKLDESLRGDKWRAHLKMVSRITKDINYMRRQTTYFWRAMVYNLERLGVQLGNEQVDEDLPRALREAQKDFITLDARLEILRRRVDSLTVMATDLMNLCAAFKGIHDSEFNLRLGLFASLVFPLTLVASIFGMGDDFLPGQGNFWIYWAASVPLFIVSVVVIDQGYTFHKVARLVGAQAKRGKEEIGEPPDVGPGGERD